MQRFYIKAVNNMSGEDMSLLVDAPDIETAMTLYRQAIIDYEWVAEGEEYADVDVEWTWVLPPLSDAPKALVWGVDITC